jgi:hypothetical protein
LEHLASNLGHADRRTPFGSYCKGLILPGERKSVEPIAACVEPSRVQGAHQSLHHFVANADWSQEALLRQVRTLVLPAIEKSGGVTAWIVDATGFPKKGVHSVGVARQYCGQLGKQDNCQIAVSLSVANEHASLPIAFRLYLPEDWAADPVRRARAGVPEEPRLQDQTANRARPDPRRARRGPNGSNRPHPVACLMGATASTRRAQPMALAARGPSPREFRIAPQTRHPTTIPRPARIAFGAPSVAAVRRPRRCREPGVIVRRPRGEYG